jgi:hypothetical protein
VTCTPQTPWTVLHTSPLHSAVLQGVQHTPRVLLVLLLVPRCRRGHPSQRRQRGGQGHYRYQGQHLVRHCP